jgi:hypothetical protein
MCMLWVLECQERSWARFWYSMTQSMSIELCVRKRADSMVYWAPAGLRMCKTGLDTH